MRCVRVLLQMLVKLLLTLMVLVCVYCIDRAWTVIKFLQRASIACYAKRCISNRKSVCLSDRLSVTRWYQAKTT